MKNSIICCVLHALDRIKQNKKKRIIRNYNNNNRNNYISLTIQVVRNKPITENSANLKASWVNGDRKREALEVYISIFFFLGNVVHKMR